jgi:peptidyl-prolyl cis-trans isomerase D
MINISEERSRDEAEKLINDISKQLSDKNNFLELVKLFSEDEATIDFEGSLGVSTGESFPKEFENALRVLKVGEFSEPIELDNSFHILLLTELNQPSPETYIKKSDSIREKLMEVQLNSNYFSLLDKANNLIYSSNDFTEISSSLGISAITTGFFSKDLLEEKLNYQIVEDFIFTEDRSNGISEVLEVDDSIAFILEVVDINQATILSFEDVQNKVQDSLRSKLASEIIFKKSSDFINDVELSSFKEALKKNNITKQSYKEVSRDSSLLPNKALADLFGISRGTSNNELFISNQTNGDIFILSLDEVNDAATEISEDQIDQFTKLMQQERVNSLVSQVQRSLEENADIVLLNNLDN